MRTIIGLAVALALAGCGGGGTTQTDTVFMSGTAMQSRIAALADCPSPLTRLGIARIRPKVMIGAGGVVDFVIPSSEEASGSAVHFKLKPGGSSESLKVIWSVELSDAASEFDLGEDRLLNPLKLTKDLEKAVSDYLEFYAQSGTSEYAQDGKKRLAASCRTIGRLVDGIAVTTNPALRRTLEQQKRRDALGWLFKDGYRLKTDSPAEAYWDGDRDYSDYDY
jgi:hypothetical protein